MDWPSCRFENHLGANVLSYLIVPQLPLRTADLTKSDSGVFSRLTFALMGDAFTFK